MVARAIVSTVLTGLLLSMTALPSAAQATREDFQTFQDVTREVRRYVNYTVFDSVAVGVENGVVTLTGKVTMPYKRSEIGRRVAGVPGVLEVDNQIEVLPVSQYDDELRSLAARSIYGNPNFWRYASMVNPPIHIVVEGGHVTLQGVVRNQVDRMLAGSLAISLGAVSVTNELKTDKDVQALHELIG